MNPNKTCNIKLVHLLSVTQRPPSCQLSFQRRCHKQFYTGSKMKKSSSQEQKMASDDDPLSPWRAAKPRKPLRDLADAQDSPKGRRQEQENESPPNSSHKESTRLESGLRGVGSLDLSQVVGHCHSFQAWQPMCGRPLVPWGRLQHCRCLLNLRLRLSTSQSWRTQTTQS